MECYFFFVSENWYNLFYEGMYYVVLSILLKFIMFLESKILLIFIYEEIFLVLVYVWNVFLCEWSYFVFYNVVRNVYLVYVWNKMVDMLIVLKYSFNIWFNG